MPDAILFRCARCNVEKARDEFGKRTSWCSACFRAHSKARYHADPAASKAVSVQWAKDNPGRVRENQRKTREKHRDKWVPWFREHYRQNKERIGARVKQYREANADKVRVASQRKYQRTKEQYKEGVRRRREANRDAFRARGRKDAAARRVGRNPEAIAYVALIARDPCAYCGGVSTEIEHIDALKAGGANVPDNIARACKRCNSSKGKKPLLLFLAHRAQARAA